MNVRIVVTIGALALIDAGCSAWTTSRRSDAFQESDVPVGYYAGKSDIHNAINNGGQNEAPATGLARGVGVPRTASQKLDVLGQPKKRAAILNFWNDTPVQQDELGAFTADELRRGLSLTQRIIIPGDVRAQLMTEDFLSGEQVQVGQLVREGRRMGVSVIAIGRITKIVYRQKGDPVGFLRQKQSLAAVEVEMKLFDTQAGREILASTKYGEAAADTVSVIEDAQIDNPAYRAELTKNAVRQALSGFIPEIVGLVDRMKWQGRIAKMIGQKAYLNAGHQTGLMSGDILSVMNIGDDIYDPITGTNLGRTTGRIKGTIEIVDFVGSDAAVARIHTGGNFKEGDVVQLY